MPTKLPSYRSVGAVNTAFLLDKEGVGCGKEQQLRELVQNGIEAIQAAGGVGEIEWDVDLLRVRESRGRERKLSVVDTGTGMTGPDMVRLLGDLASSGRRQGLRENFGMGAKIALAFHNRAGVVWRSWTAGGGAEITLRHFTREETGGAEEYGLQRYTWADGSVHDWRPIGDELRPPLLQDHATGTQVILLGDGPTHDTTVAPPTVKAGVEVWIRRYLNSRFHDLPPTIRIRVRERHRHNTATPTVGTFAEVVGHARLLAQHAARESGASGTVPLERATAHWWLLGNEPTEEPDDRATPAKGRAHREGRRRRARPETPAWVAKGHVAVLHRSELYGLLSPIEGGYETLRASFGIRGGTERVVIYVEPDEDLVDIDIKRTHITIAGNDAPWATWGAQFRARMPQALTELQEEAARDSSSAAIKTRLARIATLYTPPPYRPPARPRAPAPDNGDAADHQLPTQSSLGGRHDDPDPAEAPVEDRAPRAHDPHSSDEQTEPSPPAADEPQRARSRPARRSGPRPSLPELPEVHWISTKDGTREEGDLEDLVARYSPATHALTINADFRLVTAMVDEWTAQYPRDAGAKATITEHVRESFAQSLIEAVLTTRGLRGSSPAWPRLSEGALTDPVLTPEALTLVVQPRQLMHSTLKKQLAQQLGRPATVDR